MNDRGEAEARAEATQRADAGLTDEETLLERYYRSRDEAVRDALVERFLPFARRLASRFSDRGESFEDLVGVASLGLMKAIEGYKPGEGPGFQAYAAPTILGELRRHFRDRRGAVHVPRGIKDLTPRIGKATDKLFGELGRSPTLEELAEELQVELDELLDALQAGDASRPASLESDGRRAGEEEHTMLSERVGQVDPSFEAAEDRTVIEARMNRLSARDRTVLHLRFSEDLTQSEIGERIGVSQMQVSRILRYALEELRRE